MGSPLLTVFHAGSFGPVLERAVAQFSLVRPDVSVVLEGAGARRIARWMREGRVCDLVASADDAVIDEFLRPDLVGFNLRVARNRMVLGFRATSRYADQIDETNWPEVLRRPDVRLGMTDPEDDPGGYRALQCWQLAEAYYRQPGLARALAARVPGGNVFRTRGEIEAAYATGRVDYCFGYESGARLGGHRWIRLPREVDLSDPGLANGYARAVVELSGRDPGTRMAVYGRPIAYSVAIPRRAPQALLAAEFLGCWLEAGPTLIEAGGLIPLAQPELPEEELPELPDALRPLVAASAVREANLKGAHEGRKGALCGKALSHSRPVVLGIPRVDPAGGR